MAILRAWGDESGDSADRDPHFGMGAVIGRQDQWVIFEDLWQKVLDKHEIHELHMKKIVMARNEPPSSPFSKFSDQSLLDSLLSDINKTIAASGIICRAHSVFSDNFESMLNRHGLGSDMYSFCLYQTVLHLGTWALNEHENDPSFELVMDRKDKHVLRESRAKRLYDEDSFASWRGWPQVNILSAKTGRGSRHILPIQAADYVAWLTRRLLRFGEPWLRENIPSGPPGGWWREFEIWVLQRLTTLKQRFPAEILFFNAAVQLVNQGILMQYFYNEDMLVNHVVQGRQSRPPAAAMAKSIALAGEYPLTP
jgi:hypothetical protein